MGMNQACGFWSVEQTNWSKNDQTEIQDVLKETTERTSYQELLAEHEAKLLQ